MDDDFNEKNIDLNISLEIYKFKYCMVFLDLQQYGFLWIIFAGDFTLDETFFLHEKQFLTLRPPGSYRI